jgi:hypothetical protein
VALRRQSDYPNKLINLSAGGRKQTKIVWLQDALACPQLQLSEKQQETLKAKGAGRRWNDRTRQWTQAPDPPKIWIGHFHDCDIEFDADSGLPLRLKKSTEHADDSRPAGENGLRPPPLPCRPLDGRDAVVPRTRLSAAARTGRPEPVPDYTPMAVAGGKKRKTPSPEMGRGREPGSLAEAEVIEAVVGRGGERNDDKIPEEAFGVTFHQLMGLLEQVETHSARCTGKLVFRSREMSVHGLVGRMVGRCEKEGGCACAYRRGARRVVWTSSPINPDGERDVSGKPFLDYVLNDLFAAVLATTSALYESTSTLFRNMGFKLRGKAITLAYEKEKAVPVVQVLREEELERVLDDRPGRADGDPPRPTALSRRCRPNSASPPPVAGRGGAIVPGSDVGHSSVDKGQYSSGVGICLTTRLVAFAETSDEGQAADREDIICAHMMQVRRPPLLSHCADWGLGGLLCTRQKA